MKKLTAIDICCGCGGLSIGLRRGGFDVLLGVDFDREILTTFELNQNYHGAKSAHEDLETLTARNVQRLIGRKRVDLVAGCPPCQGFSRLRTKNGSQMVDDARKSLVGKFVSLAIDMSPRVILMENVPGLEKSQEFSDAVDQLCNAGFNVIWSVLNACDYGVPQYRERLVVLASKKCFISLAKPTAIRKTVRDTIGRLPVAGVSGDKLHDWLSLHTPLVQTRIKAIPKDGGSRTQLPAKLRLACHVKADGFKDVYGRMKWDAPAPTITGGCINPSKGRFLHPQEDRAITLREALLLQGFPMKFVLPIEKSRQLSAQMIGNAFPPAFAAAQARAIAKSMRTNS